MENLSVQEWLALGIVAMFALAKFFKLLGWDRGAFIADELRDALHEARGFIASAREGGGAEDIERAAAAAAAKVRGLDVDDARPIIENLVKNGGDSRYGVTVSLDGNGGVRVDPSGAVNKAGRKLGKWFKKVF